MKRDPKAKLQEVASVVVEGVQIDRHPLDRLVQQQLRVADVLGQRVIDWDRAASPVDEVPIAIVKAAEISHRIVSSMLSEQRQRAEFAVKHPSAAMSDEEFREQLTTYIRKLTPEQLDELYLGDGVDRLGKGTR